MCRKTENGLKHLDVNRPEKIVALSLVEGAQYGFVRYYVRYPVKMGPQPLLGIAWERRTHTFCGENAYTPAAVYKAATKGENTKIKPVEIEWYEPVFTDALTVLPESEADRTRTLDERADPVLLSAFSVVAAHYETRVSELLTDSAFMSRIPASLDYPPYKPAIVRHMQLLAKQVLKREDEEAFFRPENRLARIAVVHLTRWHLWNQEVNGATTSERWPQYWKILKAWNRWQSFDMTWRERAKEMANDKKTSIAQGKYLSEGENLRVFCSRMGLHMTP